MTADGCEPSPQGLISHAARRIAAWHPLPVVPLITPLHAHGDRSPALIEGPGRQVRWLGRVVASVARPVVVPVVGPSVGELRRRASSAAARTKLCGRTRQQSILA